MSIDDIKYEIALNKDDFKNIIFPRLKSRSVSTIKRHKRKLKNGKITYIKGHTRKKRTT